MCMSKHSSLHTQPEIRREAGWDPPAMEGTIPRTVGRWKRMAPAAHDETTWNVGQAMKMKYERCPSRSAGILSRKRLVLIREIKV